MVGVEDDTDLSGAGILTSRTRLRTKPTLYSGYFFTFFIAFLIPRNVLYYIYTQREIFKYIENV